MPSISPPPSKAIAAGPERRARTSDAYWTFIGPFGGVSAATALRAVLEHPEREGDPLALTVNFCAPIARGEFKVRLRRTRANRSSQHWSVEFTQGESAEAVLTATVVTAARRDSFSHQRRPRAGDAGVGVAGDHAEPVVALLGGAVRIPLRRRPARAERRAARAAAQPAFAAVAARRGAAAARLPLAHGDERRLLRPPLPGHRPAAAVRHGLDDHLLPRQRRRAARPRHARRSPQWPTPGCSTAASATRPRSCTAAAASCWRPPCKSPTFAPEAHAWVRLRP